MELSYIWPFTAYKVSEMYKRYFGNPIPVMTSHGPIQGVEVTSQFGYKYTGFQGVPYGKAPVGELRFKVSFYYICVLKNFNGLFKRIPNPQSHGQQR